MPTPRTSPPLARPGRSPGSKRRSDQNFTPPVPMWDSSMVMPPVPLSDKRDRQLHTPVQLSDPPRSPRLPPAHQAAYDVTVSSPRVREPPKPALMSPPVIAPISPSIMNRRQKLLPAIPITLDSPSGADSRSRRVPPAGGIQDLRAHPHAMTYVPVGEQRMSGHASSPAQRAAHPAAPGSRDSPPSAGLRMPAFPAAARDLPAPALRHRQSTMSLSKQANSPASSSGPNGPGPTPPRPARRRRDSMASPKPRDLAPPRPDFSRAASPSGDSISTLSDAPTPRAADRAIPEEFQLPSKRDSTQRRLDALRGLVANLDFNQPWSLTEEAGPSDWSPCSGGQESLISPRSAVPMTNSGLDSVHRHRGGARFIWDAESASSERWPSQDHGWIDTPPQRASRSSRTSQQQQHQNQRTPQQHQGAPTRARTESFKVASSGYSKCLEPDSPTGPTAPPTPEQTWRATLTSDLVYQSVMTKHGPDGVKRQEIIWEMCETEQTFLRSMRNVLRLFAIPLKTPHGNWIDGIPDRISALFDALESVTHAHGIIAATVRDLRRKSEVVDMNAFVRAYKSWVPKLEVYERYLLRFEPVVALVEEHIRDADSVFGEFVRLQSKEDALGSMTLGSMLLKPVQRLMKYPLFFKRLLDATPCHPDLLSLLASTESTILTLQAAKAKEEDFDQLVQLESRLFGLPADFLLAQRGRKLTGHGSVLRVQPNAYPGMMTSSRSSVASALSSAGSPWESTHSPAASRASSFSVSSVSSSVPSRSGSLRMSPSAFSLSPKRPSIHRSPSSASSTGGTDASLSASRPSTPSKKRAKDELSLFVFDDLVILATPIDRAGIFSSKSKKDKGWRILPEHEGGIGKLVEVKDWSGFGGHAALFVLTILPLSSQSIRETLTPVSVCLTISSSSSSSSVCSPRGRTPLKCPQLSTVTQFLSALTQATTASSSDHSLHGIEEDKGGGHEHEEVLFHAASDLGTPIGVEDRVEIAFESGGDEHPLYSLQAMGYAH